MKIWYVVFFDTFDGQSNVLRLVKVFTVPDLPIHPFSLYVYVCQNLYAKFGAYIYIDRYTAYIFDVCIYIYIYIYIYIHV